MVSKFRNQIASKVRQQMMASGSLNQASKSVIKNRVQSVQRVDLKKDVFFWQVLLTYAVVWSSELKRNASMY